MKKKKSRKYLGKYELPYGQSVIGQLRLKGANALLKLHSDEYFSEVNNGAVLNGRAFSGEHITLINCFSLGVGQAGHEDGHTTYSQKIIPHHVAIGRRHLLPNSHSIKAIHFTITDLNEIFNDYEAFGSFRDARDIIDSALKKSVEQEHVEIGEFPQAFYFTGKFLIAEVSTSIGRISVHHGPTFNMPGTSGIHVRNRIALIFEPTRPIMFGEAVDRIYDIGCFLSIVAGRAQGVRNIAVSTIDSIENIPDLRVHASFGWKFKGKANQNRPRSRDLPLDPVRRSEEFATVLCNWIDHHNDWRFARFRYMDCLRKVNTYDRDRLVAAANMFDILPTYTVPVVNELSSELVATRDSCISMFRKSSPGVDRDSALSALGRLGKPSLPKKVAYRVAIVYSVLGGRFPDLDFVTGIAIKFRNFYVHGSNAPEIDFHKVEHLMPFLTDALEFTFAASDLIEAGWDAKRWGANRLSYGHSFGRFHLAYEKRLMKLKQAIQGG